MGQRIVVTGFLGAGKSALAARLRAALPGHEVVEADGRAAPGAESRQGPTICVADAANLADCLADRMLGPLLDAQIRAAGLVVLTRTDIVPAGPALQALSGITQAPVVEVVPGRLPEGLPGQIAALPSAAIAGPPVAPAFAEWRYAGPAEVPERSLEALLARRPEGLYRLSGIVRCVGQGVEVELVGRLRQTRAVPLPAETSLVAIGPRTRFRPDRMALAFSDAVAARGWLAGLFGHR